MAWQLLAIWAIVISTIVWFVRDERGLRDDAALVAAAAYYAHAPKYRYRASRELTAAPTPPRRTGGLSQSQRKFLELMAQRGGPGEPA